MNPSNSFNVLLLGKRGCGKSTYINMLLGNIITEMYYPTNGIDYKKIIFASNYGALIFNIIEWCENDDNINGLLPERRMLSLSDAIIVMMDYTPSSERYCKKLIDSINVMNISNAMDKISITTAPIFVIQSKMDICDGFDIMFNQQSRIQTPYNMSYIHTKTSRASIELPFLRLAKTLMNKDDLIFIHNM
jgi:GTPase SAR1 family protein